jgi:hypothetical protein
MRSAPAGSRAPHDSSSPRGSDSAESKVVLGLRKRLWNRRAGRAWSQTLEIVIAYVIFDDSDPVREVALAAVIPGKHWAARASGASLCRWNSGESRKGRRRVAREVAGAKVGHTVQC